MNADKNLRSTLWQYATGMMKNREIGAIEACDRLFGHHLYAFSRGDSPIYLNTRRADQKYRRVKDFKQVEGLPADSKDYYFKNWGEDYYPARPKEWENKCIFELYENWKFVKTPPSGGKLLEGRALLDETTTPDNDPLDDGVPGRGQIYMTYIYGSIP